MSSTDTTMVADTNPSLPLKGLRVVVTRAEAQADKLSYLLREAGAEPIEYPTIAVVPPEDWTPLDMALAAVAAGSYEWLVLTSVNGVRFVAERLAAQGIKSSALDCVRLAAVGPATVKAIRKHLEREVALVPETFVGEALAEAMGNVFGQRVLLALAELARPVLADMLRSAGATVDRVVAYRTVPATGGPDMAALLAEGHVDVITFTSSSSVRFFAARVGMPALLAARATQIACIGPVTASTAVEIGLPPTVVANPSTMEGLVAALIDSRMEKSL